MTNSNTNSLVYGLGSCWYHLSSLWHLELSIHDYVDIYFCDVLLQPLLVASVFVASVWGESKSSRMLSRYKDDAT